MMEAPIKIIGFCYKNAIEKDPVLAEKGWHAFEPEIKILSLPCSSKVETLSIIKAFEAGSDGIFVLGCPEKTCRLRLFQPISPSTSPARYSNFRER